MSEPWTPTDPELNQIFRDLGHYRHAVLAVSGGSDSVALMHLAARWAALCGADAPRLSVASVDHGLRPGSAETAEQTAAAARALGLAATVLPWIGEKPSHGIQEQARTARYRLIGEFARSCSEGPCAVVTAHTLEDQAETLLMRLARGSGPDGLQGMRPVRPLPGFDGIDVVRPLLGTGRADLRSYLEARGVSWIEDPSNEDRRFERVRLRAVAGELMGIGLTPRMLSLAATRQRRVVAALEAATDALQAAAVDLNGGMFASIDAGSWRAAPEDIRVRLFGRMLGLFGGASPAAELAQVETLAGALTGGAIRQTLGGCEVRACRKVIRVFRERGRADLADIRLRPGEATTWDNRFHISVARALAPVTVRALDGASMAGLRQSFRVTLPARAAATLPAVWAGDELVSVGGLPDHLFWPSGERAGASVQTRFVLSPSQTLP